MSWRIPYLESSVATARRRGVSLLEVLFSIGIVAVGLLGIMVLLPVGGSRVTHGVVADMGDRVGRSAIRQFDVQFMRQPNMWAHFNGTAYEAVSRSWTQTDASGNKTTYLYSFCIDPLCVATLVDTGAYTIAAGYFPAFDPSVVAGPRMVRISLRTAPGAASGMQQSQAEQAFLYQDDLTVSLPDDRTLLPTQNFGASNVKRQYEGRFSWLATLTPMRKDPSDPFENDLYVLSIIVFHRRDLKMTLPVSPPSLEEPENERLVSVTFPAVAATASGGGEVTLVTRDSSRPEKDLQLAQGEWVMLMDNVAGQPVFKWYRILSVEPESVIDPATGEIHLRNVGGLYQRDVTLFGQDWVPSLTTQALLMNGVVAVYEKTIRLETSSLWTVQ